MDISHPLFPLPGGVLDIDSMSCSIDCSVCVVSEKIKSWSSQQFSTLQLIYSDLILILKLNQLESRIFLQKNRHKGNFWDSELNMNFWHNSIKKSIKFDATFLNHT